jgi:hypothetical protein
MRLLQRGKNISVETTAIAGQALRVEPAVVGVES